LRVQPQLLEAFDERGPRRDPRGQVLENDVVLDPDLRVG
jgi:hypothetical protein